MIKVLRYQIEQNKLVSKVETKPVIPTVELEVGAMLFKFSDWSNLSKLLLTGREYFSRLAKHYQKCDTCGVFFKKDDEVYVDNRGYE